MSEDYVLESLNQTTKISSHTRKNTPKIDKKRKTAKSDYFV